MPHNGVIVYNQNANCHKLLLAPEGGRKTNSSEFIDVVSFPPRYRLIVDPNLCTALQQWLGCTYEISRGSRAQSGGTGIVIRTDVPVPLDSS